MRRFLTPRALWLTAVAGVLAAAMISLGLWQLGTYDEQQRNDVAGRLDQRPVPLDEVLGPDDSFPATGRGRPVTVSGRYLEPEQLYVEGLQGAEARYAVVTPLLTDSGSAVLVVRGSADQPRADVPEGEVEVTGLLAPPSAEGSRLDAGRLGQRGLRVSALVESVSRDLYGGYVIARGEPATDLAPVRAEPPEPSRWVGVRNLLYAMQWWLFAAFVAFMWWRIVRDDAGPDGCRPGESRPSESIGDDPAGDETPHGHTTRLASRHLG